MSHMKWTSRFTRSLGRPSSIKCLSGDATFHSSTRNALRRVRNFGLRPDDVYHHAIQGLLDGEDREDVSCEMDIKIDTDKFGKTIKYQMFEGRRYTPFYNPECLQGVRNFGLRPDDIYIPTYPRTGTHWMYEIISMLLNGKAETIPRFKGKNQLEQTTEENVADLPSPRVMNCHFILSENPRDMALKKCKIVYNVRDPRDVAVSMYRLYVDMKYSDVECSFEGFFYLFLEGKVEVNGIFEHYLDAEKWFKEHPENKVFIQVYEETLKDPVGTVQRISDFLGLPRNDELCKAIADKCHFDKMKVDKQNYSFTVDGKNVLFRKGTVGDWRNYFTDQMLEDYYRVWEEKMAGSRFYERYARPN